MEMGNRTCFLKPARAAHTVATDPGWLPLVNQGCGSSFAGSPQPQILFTIAGNNVNIINATGAARVAGQPSPCRYPALPNNQMPAREVKGLPPPLRGVSTDDPETMRDSPFCYPADILRQRKVGFGKSAYNAALSITRDVHNSNFRVAVTREEPIIIRVIKS